MEVEYSKRELDHMFDDIKQDLKLILGQTTLHNGRMSKLEKYQAYTQGALAVLGIFVVPVLGWIVYQVVSFGNLDDRISVGIDKALSEYEVKIK